MRIISGRVLLGLGFGLLVLGLSLPGIAGRENRLTPEKMKTAIIQKNIFQPGRTPPTYTRTLPQKTPLREPGPVPLKRPFTFVAYDNTEAGPRAHLQFEKPSEPRMSKVGDVIEDILTIKEIYPTYIRCEYGNQSARIDIGETSDDALARLRGFGSDYELIGTKVLPEIAFAYIIFQGRSYRMEIGEKLGNTEIVNIEPGKVRLRYEDGFEYDIPVKAVK